MRRLLVFARPPVAGQVKSRLSPALPQALAADLYHAISADAFEALRAAAADGRTVWWSTGDEPAPAGFERRLQQGADLGERLLHAFAETFAAGATHALVVASDTPAMNAAHVDRAFAQLDRYDLVVGPAHDGGYWCLGLKRQAPELFRDVPWSTNHVLATTLARARHAGQSMTLADTLDDVDTPADLARVVGLVAAGRATCGARVHALLVASGLAPDWAASG